MKFTVKLFEVAKDPDLKSPAVKHNGRVMPQDLVPNELRGFPIAARNHDVARKLAREKLTEMKRTVRSISFDALHRNQILAYVFKE